MDLKEDIILPDQGDNIIRTKLKPRKPHNGGLGLAIFEALIENKNKIGQIEASSGKEETFQDILTRAVRVACHLKKLGITPKDILTPCTTNHLNSAVVFHAIIFSGAKVASIDPFAPYDDRIKQLRLVEPKLIFAIPETVEILEEIIEELKLGTRIVVFGKSEKHLEFDQLLKPLDEEKTFEPHVVDNLTETAFIVFSSGTTGSPKGICISHTAALSSFNEKLATNAPRDVILSYASFVWASAIATTFVSTYVGSIKLQASRFHSQTFWNHIKTYKVTICFIAPQDCISLLKSEKPENFDATHMKILYVAGGSLSEESVLTLRRMFPTTLIFCGYGATELWSAALSPNFSANGRSEYLKKPKSCGRPVKGSTYKIVDLDTGKILGPNQPGELYVKSDLNMVGYYKDDSSDRFDSDGFLKTGDILYYDEDYSFFFVERSKEMLRYKMTPIAPSELELILTSHPSVKLACVFGIPTDEGDLATAVIVKNDNNVTAEELEELVKKRIDDRKRLRGGVYFVDYSEIPFTPSGKIKRRTLKNYMLQKILN